MSPPHPPLDILSTSRHTLRGQRMARPPTRKSGRKEKSLRRLVTVLITSALKRLTWTVPRRQLSNVFCASGTLPPSEKNLCRLYSTQEVRSILYTLPSLRNWACGSDQVLLKMLFDVRAQKTDTITLDIYGMIVAAFLVTDKANRVRFFERPS